MPSYELVATETVAAYKEMLAAEDWENRTDFLVKDFNRIPVKVSQAFKNEFLELFNRDATESCRWQ